MTEKHRRSRLKAFALGLLIVVLMAEILLRFFPVSTGLRPSVVDAAHTVYKFEPSHSYVFSRDWNFALANKGWVNGDGFVNDQEYVVQDDKPLLGIVGDSFIEAQMVSYRDTVSGRVAHELEGRARVYSFAAAGAPLPQYLIWASYAHEVYGADALVISVVGNDFDESLAKYRICPGQNHFVPDTSGNLELQRFDFKPSALGPFLYSSAFGRYLHLNLKLGTRVSDLKQFVFGPKRTSAEAFVGNTETEYTPERLSDSVKAVEAFFRLLPSMSGLKSDRILFVIDGMRPDLYDERRLAAASTSYFAVMRARFIEKARSLSYEIIDLQAAFLERYGRDHQRFEFATDYHWNATGHGVVAEAIERSALFRKVEGLKHHGDQGDK